MLMSKWYDQRFGSLHSSVCIKLTHHFSLLVFPKPVRGSATGCLHDHSGLKEEWECAVAQWQTFLLTFIHSELWFLVSVVLWFGAVTGSRLVHTCLVALTVVPTKVEKKQLYPRGLPSDTHLSDVLGTPSMTCFCHINVWMCGCVTSVCLDLNLCYVCLVSWLFLNVSCPRNPVVDQQRMDYIQVDFFLIIHFVQIIFVLL